MWKKLLAREGVDLTTISGIDLVFYEHIWDFTKTKDELFFTQLDGRKFTHYIGVDAQELGRYLYKKFFDSPSAIKKYYKEGQGLLKEIKEFSKNYKTSNDKEDIKKAFAEFRKQFDKVNHIYSITSWLAIEAWQNDYEQIISSLIKKHNLEKKRDIILTTAYKPWKDTAIRIMQKKIGKVSNEKLAKEYQFLRSWSIVWHKPIDKRWVEDIGNAGEKELEFLSEREVLRLLNPNPKEKRFIELAPYIIFFKDFRDDIRRSHAYQWTSLWKKIADMLDIDYDDVGYLSLDEIDSCLMQGFVDKKKIKDKIEKRKRSQIIVTMEDKQIKVLDKTPEKYTAIMKQIEKKEIKDEINGMPAQKGIAVGKAIIVRSYHDLKKVSKGSILVSNTTHPTYLPAMQKAAAFVTNEGGMTSHAAIVAREMKKPCIVGTRNATELLQNGDMIEVDANKGIVRKINKLK